MQLQERKEAFEAQHAIVKQGINAVLEVGQALKRIRDEQLYKAQGHKSFKSYFTTEFGSTIRRAYQLIEASDIAEKHNVSNERVARQLAKVPEEQRAEVLQIATERMGDDVSGAMIQDVAEELNPKETLRCRPSDERFREILKAVRLVAKAITELHEGDGKFIDVNVATAALKNIEQSVKQAVPTHECPACHGRRRDCTFCRGIGWVPNAIWDSRPERFRV